MSIDPQLATTYCAFCPKLCRSLCPVDRVAHRESLTPTGKQELTYHLRHGILEWNPERASVFYACTDCGIPATVCEHEIDIPLAMHRARAEAVERGVAPAAITALTDSFAAHGNLFGRDLSAVAVEQAKSHSLARHPRTLVFAGAATLGLQPERLGAALRILDQLGSSEGLGLHTGADQCSGYSLIAAGLLEPFQQLAGRLAPLLNRARTIICLDPVDAYTFSVLYPRHGAALKRRVLTIYQLLASRTATIRRMLRRQVTESCVFHDPCFLGRHLGQTHEPRQLLRAITERPVVEASRNRQNATCCGGGAHLSRTDPELADAITELRATELRETGAERVVTTCATCRDRLQSVLDQPVVDLLDLLDHVLAS